MSGSHLAVSLAPSKRSLLLWAAALVMTGVINAATTARAQSSLPDPAVTPGAVDPTITQDNIATTICVRGWTSLVRPPSRYTSELKRRQIRDLGYADSLMRDYEEDHLVPLALGGAPYAPQNLWPEPRYPVDGWGADRKDDLEVVLAALVCAGRVSLVDAQRAMASNWIAAYRKYVAASE